MRFFMVGSSLYQVQYKYKATTHLTQVVPR